MKKSKKNYIAIVLVVLLLALAVGYAAFSQTLTISGTATAKSGKWDVKFKAGSASATPSIVTNPTNENTATVTDDKTVTATVYLNTPGDGSEITATIENAGELDAKLTGFTVTGINGTTFTQEGNNYTTASGAVVVKVPTVTTDGTDVLAKTAEKTFTFSVEWIDGKTVAEAGETVQFEIKFTYEQDGVGTNFSGTPSWN